MLDAAREDAIMRVQLWLEDVAEKPERLRRAQELAREQLTEIFDGIERDIGGRA